MPEPVTPDAATYTVVTLGPSGAGKTVYLAALWQALRLEHPKFNFHLRLDDRLQEDKLTKVFQEVASPTDRWPLPTDGLTIPEWVFSCRVNSPHGRFDPIRVRYIDYAGERLTHPQEGSAEQERLEETLRNADALLGLLDGRKVLDLMRGDTRFLDEDMPHVFSLMQNCQGPIHFVITKWDLLAGHYSLRQIKERLLEHPDFRSLADSRRRWDAGRMPVPPGRVRLIPVSSVGLDFAFLDSEGTMRKKANARPRPFNVEVVFATVLPDLVVRAHQVAVRNRRQERAAGHGAVGQFTAALLQGATTQISTLLSLPAIHIPASLFSAFLTFGWRRAVGVELPKGELRRARRLQRSILKRSINAVKDDVSAAHFILHQLVGVLQEFEESSENDGSLLS
ncbi:hypothetical protein ACWEKM_00315 [Streptomyces sp. NPDC004752]